MKNGLIEEDGGLVFYQDGEPRHAGAIRENGAIYYIGKGGRAVRGTHNVHHEMTNGILKRGTYTFGEDYKLIPDSYIPPKKEKGHKKKAAKRMSVTRKLLIVAAVIALLAAEIVIAWTLLDKEPEEEGEEPAAEMVLPEFENDVPLCASIYKQAYDGKISIEDALSAGEPYRPLPFEYRLPDGDGTLLISEYSDLRDAREYILSAKETSLSIDNLKTGTAYYYKVTVGSESYPGSFRTAKSTRFLSLPGLFNTRDIGGYLTLDGKRVREGMLIRGTEADGLGGTADGKCYFLKDKAAAEPFGFAFEMDLRSEVRFEDGYRSRLGDGVVHKQYGSGLSYKEIFTDKGKETVKEIFADLADPQNYPLYLHCTDGADRTGTVAFLIEGALGIPEKQMTDDYMLTGAFVDGFEDNVRINGLFGGLESYEGSTVNEKIENYLLGAGVTAEQIRSIRNLLLEDA